MATLVLITSSSLYLYISYSQNYEIKQELELHAKKLLKERYKLPKKLKLQKKILKNASNIQASIEYAPYINYESRYYRIIKKGKRFFMQGFFPYNFRSQKYLILTKDITRQIQFKNKLYRAVIIVNILSLIIIIIYAFIISKMLLRPIKYVSFKLAKMNEHKLSKIDLKTLPYEFIPLGESINNLIKRIENFLYYKKELFIGAAHELKTPLAVMKTKTQVALLKKNKTIESLEEALKQSVQSINNLNNTIKSILAFGRAEGAQFEEAKEIDLIAFIQEMLEEFEILALKEEKYIIKRLKPKKLILQIQPSLFRQILQNFLQNALRFTPKNNIICVSSFLCEEHLVIRIKDSGPGLPQNFDLFAPFKKSQNSKGIGLGLFLAKIAADSIGASISLKNKKKQNGAVATIILPIKKYKIASFGKKRK